MAERTSSRASSRRATPQPAPQDVRSETQSSPKPSIRTTRSQSRGLGDNEERRSELKGRAGAKQATSDATNDAVGDRGLQSGKGRPTNRARVQQDLSVVIEDPSVAYPDLENAEGAGASENLEDAVVDQRPIQQLHKSPGGLSAFSGTTARISSSTQELTDPSLEDMLDTLPDLSDTSDKLLSFVIPTEITEGSVATTMVQLRENGTRENKRLKRLGDTFSRQRKEYGGDSYINVGDMLRKLLGREPGPIDEQAASWRPDVLLQKANLAVLVLRLLSIAGQDEKDQTLEDIAGAFPQAFVQRLGGRGSLTPECSALAEATFHMALEIRTQEAIMLLARHVGKINFDPSNALLQVFYDGKKLKGWPVTGLRVTDLGKEAEDAIVARVEQLRKAFKFDELAPFDDQSSGVESLRANFPRNAFVQQMITWAGQRLTEIEILTTNYGGAQAICKRLSDVIQNSTLGQPPEGDGVDYDSGDPESQSVFYAPSQSRATSEQQDASARPARADELNLAQFSADSNKLRSAAAILKRREANRKVAKAPKQASLPQSGEIESFVQVASTAGPAIQASSLQQNSSGQVIGPADVDNVQGPLIDQYDNWPPEDNAEEEENINIQRNAEASLAYRTQREAESNKENVAEIPESQQSSKMSKKRNLLDRDPLAERIPPVGSDDSDIDGHEVEISSDEGFQTQVGGSNAVRQRRMKPATKRPASEPKRRSPKKVRVQEHIDVQTLDGRVEAVGDRLEADLSPSQGYEEYVRVNQSAKQKMAGVSKPPQSRKAWTSAETDMLYYLITEHGTSWTLLKEEDRAQGHILEERDQVALKDKARNMKMDYLKAGRVLPQNFERIPLSQLQVKRLNAGGIEYDHQTGTRVDAEVIED